MGVKHYRVMAVNTHLGDDGSDLKGYVVTDVGVIEFVGTYRLREILEQSVSNMWIELLSGMVNHKYDS